MRFMRRSVCGNPPAPGDRAIAGLCLRAFWSFGPSKNALQGGRAHGKVEAGTGPSGLERGRGRYWAAAVMAALGLGVLTAVGPAAAAATRHAASRSPLVVTFSSVRDFQAAVQRLPVRVIRVLAPLRSAELRPVEDPRAVLRVLRGAPGIVSVQPAVHRAIAGDPALAQGLVSTPAGGAYEWQYFAAGVDRVPADVLAAARRITIAVVDTGADLSVPGLATKSTTTFDVRTGSRIVSDSSGHGTFVASLAGGSSVAGGGINGFGGDAKLMIVKVADDASFNDADVAAGIVYAVKHGANIINLSVAGTRASAVERRAVAYAAARGVLVVAAAGNDALSGNPIEYPAGLLQPVGSSGKAGLGLAVGASDFSGQRAPFSSHGSFLSLVAPGANVFGAVASNSPVALFPRVVLPGATIGLYGFASGTSFAAPEVAGAAALVWAANPSLSARRVAAILEATASGDGRWTSDLGYGVLDVAAAVQAARA
jgi:subtilisin family serine protease